MDKRLKIGESHLGGDPRQQFEGSRKSFMNANSDSATSLSWFGDESSSSMYAGASVSIPSAYQDLLLLDVVLEELLGLRFADHYRVHGLQVARVGGQRYSNLKQHSSEDGGCSAPPRNRAGDHGLKMRRNHHDEVKTRCLRTAHASLKRDHVGFHSTINKETAPDRQIRLLPGSDTSVCLTRLFPNWSSPRVPRWYLTSPTCR
jgi:hypothetical protein